MKKRVCLISLLITALICFPSSAALKTIPNVIISCTGRVEPNSILSELVVDTSGSGTGDINLAVSGIDYYIDDCSISGGSDRFVRVGDEIKIRVVLVPSDEETHAFSGTYSSSNVKINGGTYLSSAASKSSLTVTFKMNPVSGKLPGPESPGWRTGGAASAPVASPEGPGSGKGSSGTGKSSSKVSGTARWSNPSGGTGYYEIWLYRGNTCIYKVEDYKGNSYDFYPYMTKEGTYYYKIRTVPHTAEQKKYAQRSDFEVSDELYIDAENVSDGRKTDDGLKDTTTVGWVKSGTTWYYRYPNGNLKKNGWEKVNDKWYLFDREGKMLTGLQTITSGTYCLAATGEMLTGWRQIDKKWYFFESTAGSVSEGAMFKDRWIYEADKKTYYLGSDGIMCTGWKQIGDIWYHFDETGNLSRDTWIDTFYVDPEGKWIQNK